MDNKTIGQVVNAILEIKGVYKAVKYFSPTEVLCATRNRYKGKILRESSVHIALKYGKPNFEQREFIKKCKKAGEPFPLKKIQLKFVK